MERGPGFPRHALVWGLGPFSPLRVTGLAQPDPPAKEADGRGAFLFQPCLGQDAEPRGYVLGHMRRKPNNLWDASFPEGPWAGLVTPHKHME